MAPNPSGETSALGEPLMRRWDGAVRPGCVVSLLLLAVAAYAGVIVLESEIEYRSLQEEVQRQAGFAAERSEEEMRTAILAKVQSLELPRMAEQVEVRRLPRNRISITLRYGDTLTFFGRWDWVRPRRIQVERAY